MYIVWIMCILGGIFLLWRKYRIVIGGIRIKAVVVERGLADESTINLGHISTVGPPPGLRAHDGHNVFCFFYNDSYLTKPVAHAEWPLPIGSWRYIYYNPKRPDFVARISLIALVETILFFGMIALGLFMLIFPLI